MNRLGFAVWLPLLWLASTAVARSEERSPVAAGGAVDLMFDQLQTSKLKARGLLQRTTFADLLAESERGIQLAFVIDGTDSMGADIQSVLASLDRMIEDLRQQKGAKLELSFNLVVYRDSGAKSGIVVFPLGKAFTADLPKVKQSLGAIATEPGVPYFEEMVDVGLHQAITELKWQPDEDVSRWILLCGDAPPYDEGRLDQNGAMPRKHSTAELVEAARRKKIVVNSILCSSGFVGDQATANPEIKKAYSDLLPRTRGFLSQLASATGGANWDLSNEGLRAAMMQAATKGRTQYRPIDGIKPADLEAVRKDSRTPTSNDPNQAQIRLAVLPHSPLAKMSFDPQDPAVQVSTELRHRLGLVPHVELRNAADVETGYEVVKDPALSEPAVLQKLAAQLDVDYVIWGDYQAGKNEVKIRSAAYQHGDGKRLVETEQIASTNSGTAKARGVSQIGLVPQVCKQLAVKLSESLKKEDGGSAPAKALDAVMTNPIVGEGISAPLAKNVRALREMLAGYEALERSLGWPKGSEDSADLLNSAVLSLGAAANHEADNPWTQYLLANVHFNRADSGTKSDEPGKFYECLQNAYNLRDQLSDRPLRTEVEALYALLIEQDSAKSVHLYQSLLAPGAGAGRSICLRAHWMLSGIYSGDWGAGAKAVNANRARHHIMRILAHWERSPEAAFYREVMHWDEKDGTRHPFVPLQNVGLQDLASR